MSDDCYAHEVAVTCRICATEVVIHAAGRPYAFLPPGWKIKTMRDGLEPVCDTCSDLVP